MSDPIRSSCPDAGAIEAYVANEAGVDRGAIERHAAGCASCREALMAAGLGRAGDAEASLQAVLAAPPRPALLEVLQSSRAPQAQGATARRDLGRIARWASAPLVAACALVVLGWHVLHPDFDRLVSTRLAGERRIEARPSIVLPHAELVAMRGAVDGGDYHELLGRLLPSSSDPAAARALAVLALWQHGKGDVEEARRRLQQVPASPERSNDLALAELLDGRPEQALPLLRSALVANPRMLPALFNQALVLQQLGRRQEAIAAWNAYLDRGGAAEPGWADEARRNLRSLQERP